MRRRIVRTALFEETVAALDDSREVRLVLETLILRAGRWPHAGELLPGTAARVLRSLPYHDCPAVRLIYRVTRTSIFLYRADYYDALVTAPHGSA